ncbi:hypothetical protein K457DRAFT_575609 [Linnemannia elongata AG-77]|uniref:Uncharacterized protein n=1 Tax=Linnemannia elongata AG-77 TaxID=1314771 RepID=A0A197KCH4_9FUNG|nr:hypothetical protein K457DRAFT_575609 [Linnemannia elongata AG-77]
MPIPYCHHHRHLSCPYFHILTLAFSLLISLLSPSFLRPSDPLSLPIFSFVSLYTPLFITHSPAPIPCFTPSTRDNTIPSFLIPLLLHSTSFLTPSLQDVYPPWSFSHLLLLSVPIHLQSHITYSFCVCVHACVCVCLCAFTIQFCVLVHYCASLLYSLYVCSLSPFCLCIYSGVYLPHFPPSFLILFSFLPFFLSSLLPFFPSSLPRSYFVGIHSFPSLIHSHFFLFFI